MPSFIFLSYKLLVISDHFEHAKQPSNSREIFQHVTANKSRWHAGKNFDIFPPNIHSQQLPPSDALNIERIFCHNILMEIILLQCFYSWVIGEWIIDSFILLYYLVHAKWHIFFYFTTLYYSTALSVMLNNFECMVKSSLFNLR